MACCTVGLGCLWPTRTFFFSSVLLVAVAVCVFGAKGHLDHNIGVFADDTSGEVSIFSWSFWIAVASGGMALITSILYLCVGRGEEYM